MQFISLTLRLCWTTIFFVMAKDECTSNADCFTDKVIDSVCCQDSRDSIRRCTLYNCYCVTDGDCRCRQPPAPPRPVAQVPACVEARFVTMPRS